MNRTDTAALLERIHFAFGRTPTPGAIDEWQRQLEDTDPAAADEALDRIIREGGSGPSIAELIAYIPHPPTIEEPRRRHEPSDAERARVAIIQEDIAETLKAMRHRR